MKRFIIGFVLGSLLSGVSVWATLPNTRVDREYQKFLEDVDGNVAVRAIVVSQ